MALNGYRPAWWLPGPHLQTLWGKLGRRPPVVPTRIERWDTPDGDFIELHRLGAPPRNPRLILLHGLEGSPRSHYAAGLIGEAYARGWAADALVFRSCGTHPNNLLRSYHSGETGDLDFVVTRLIADDRDRPVVLVGISLGGNVLLKWLGERGNGVPSAVAAAVAISVPFDLARSAKHINRGFARVYQAHFLRTLRRKARHKIRRFPGAFSEEALATISTIWGFDDAVTAPIHGFRDATDYYTRSSSIHFISSIRVPTLLLSSADDPFLPESVLREVARVAAPNPALVTEFTAHGGHVGFVGGSLFKPRYYAEQRAIEFLDAHLGRGEPSALRAGTAPHAE
jgi:predicted alpha/beta-fold hydrolase